MQLQSSSLRLLAAASLLLSIAAARPNSGHGEGGMDMGHNMGHNDTMSKPEEDWELSYWAYGQHSGAITAHIVLEVISWCFVLPVAVMLSIAHSRFTIPTQFVFLMVNGLAIFFGLIYNTSTPDLYVNNAHHKIGWIASSVVVAQFVIGVVYAYSGRRTKSISNQYQRATFRPIPTTEQQQLYSPMHEQEYRWSGDSGQGTSCPESITEDHADLEKREEDDEEVEVPTPLARGWLRSARLDRFFSSRVPGLMSNQVLRMLRGVYNVIDRIILPFGFIALSTGGITYGGIFKAGGVFSGLAHFIKGGIFFWYGLVVLGRFMGCWANLGWSWNLKPATSRAPSGELVESSLIFTYGATNVFLEHLGGWGKAWTPQDLEHVSISVMFFGAGLCGILLESKRVKKWLKQSILGTSRSQATEDEEEKTNVSFNPMPALIIFLLGTMMGGHEQHQMVSTMVHKQWGALLSGAAMARGVTYVLTYIKPPTSYLPARPPSELIGSFCLISGGLIFMLSASDIMDVMVWYKLDAMFTFNVAIGLSCFIMAWEIVVLAIKAWASKKETSQAHNRSWSSA